MKLGRDRRTVVRGRRAVQNADVIIVIVALPRWRWASVAMTDRLYFWKRMDLAGSTRIYSCGVWKQSTLWKHDTNLILTFSLLYATALALSLAVPLCRRGGPHDDIAFIHACQSSSPPSATVRSRVARTCGSDSSTDCCRANAMTCSLQTQ